MRFLMLFLSLDSVVALLGYIAIFAGGALEILIGELLYKKPLSEFAFRDFSVMQSSDVTVPA